MRFGSLENFELDYVLKGLTEYPGMVHLEVLLVQRSRDASLSRRLTLYFLNSHSHVFAVTVSECTVTTFMLFTE